MCKVTPSVYNRRETKAFLVQTGLKGQGREKEKKELASHPPPHAPNQAKRYEGEIARRLRKYWYLTNYLKVDS